MISLTLTFSPTPGGASVRWEADVLGVRGSHFTPPFRGAELALALRAIDVLQDPYYPRAWTPGQQRHFTFDAAERETLGRLGLWAEAGRVALSAPRRVGRALYQALTADPAAARALGTARDHAAALGQPLALSLRFPPGAVELAALPWELLWDDGPAPLLLGGDGVASCTRHLDLPAALPPPPRRQGPLRILAVAPRAGIAPELRQMERAARLAAWELLQVSGQATLAEIGPATMGRLAEAIRPAPPDVIHFYGHGRYSDGEGALLLDAEDGGETWVSVGALSVLLGRAPLVLLHACQGAAVGAGEQPTLLAGVAPALCAAGAPAVMAMQFSVRTTAATRMGAAIFHALAEGASLQEAAGRARRLLYLEESDQVSWFVPVIYLRSRETGPVYLRSRAERLPAGPAPSDVRGARQLISARGKGLVAAVRMLAGQGGEQAVRAERGARVRGVRLRALAAGQQHIYADDDGSVEDIDLSDQIED